MTTNDRLDRVMSSWLHEDADFRVPDHLDEVLQATRVTRQRPVWSSLERWLPVDTTFRPRLFTVPPPGRLLLVAALILLLLAIAILAAGSQQRLPPPFGLARNGNLVTSADGNLYLIDRSTQQSRIISIGDGFDFSPTFSRDGTKLVFARSDGPLTQPAVLTLMVADATGSGRRALTPPVQNIEWWDWSPSGDRIVYMAEGALWVVEVDRGEPRKLVGTGHAHFPTWLPPDGNEIVYRLEGASPAIFAISADGTSERRQLSTTPAINRFDYQGPTVSPDGSLISFTRYTGTGEPRGFMLDHRTRAERRFPVPNGTRAETGGVFSPDGTTIAFVRYYTDATWQLIVAPADGSEEGRPVGTRSPGTPQSDNAGVNSTIFTPDGTALIVRYGNDDAATSHILPIDGTPGSIVNEGAFEFVDMQRLAP
jgi:Tol biopolymer transport system component